jgi:hypothetical protein
MTNRLAHAQSPYLRQHADNPAEAHLLLGDAFGAGPLDARPSCARP